MFNDGSSYNNSSLRGGKSRDLFQPFFNLTKPEGWEDYSYWSIHEHFKCLDHAHDQNKQLYTLAKYKFMKDKYFEIEGRPAVDFAEAPPYEAKISPEKGGRGIVALRDIKKGELVHDGAESTTYFSSGDAF